jgi:hypothetical protein
MVDTKKDQPEKTHNTASLQDAAARAISKAVEESPNTETYIRKVMTLLRIPRRELPSLEKCAKQIDKLPLPKLHKNLVKDTLVADRVQKLREKAIHNIDFLDRGIDCMIDFNLRQDSLKYSKKVHRLLYDFLQPQNFVPLQVHSNGHQSYPYNYIPYISRNSNDPEEAKRYIKKQASSLRALKNMDLEGRVLITSIIMSSIDKMDAFLNLSTEEKLQHLVNIPDPDEFAVRVDAEIKQERTHAKAFLQDNLKEEAKIVEAAELHKVYAPSQEQEQQPGRAR